jgi:hypothetical protein
MDAAFAKKQATVATHQNIACISARKNPLISHRKDDFRQKQRRKVSHRKNRILRISVCIVTNMPQQDVQACGKCSKKLPKNFFPILKFIG